MTRSRLPRTTLDAKIFALAWQATSIASSPDAYWPMLHRTVCLEGLTGGVGMVSTDSYFLARSFVATHDETFRYRYLPKHTETPRWSVIVEDADGLLATMLKHVLRNTPIDGKVTLSQRQDGRVDAAFGDTVRVTLNTVPGPFVYWRPLWVNDKAVDVEDIALGSSKLRQLARFERFYPNSYVRLRTKGSLKPLKFSYRHRDRPPLDGLLMPVRISSVEWGEDDA